MSAIREANTQRCEEPVADDELTSIINNVWKQPDRLAFDPLAPIDVEDRALRNASTSLNDSTRQSQADKIIEALGDIELFNDGMGGEYASFFVNGHLETHHLASKRFHRHCKGQYYTACKGAATDLAIKSAIDLCKAKATFSGASRLVGMRVAERDGTIWLDLCDDAWQVVERTDSGWQLKAATDVDVRFWRPTYAQELPVPVRGAKLVDFRDLFNTDGAGWTLIQVALLAMLRPSMPQPVLALYGRQGSGKSLAGSMIRRLLDPNASDLRAEPHDTRDLASALRNNFIIGIDNVSRLSSQMSDALCRVTTGSGFAARELYTDVDERLIVARRPVILTAIEEVITRGDLMDRALVVRLRSISQQDRKTDDCLQETFAIARPRLLGALLDATVIAFQNLPEVRNRNLALPRLADLARWATAAEDALDLPAGQTFLEMFKVEHARASISIVEADVISEPLTHLIDSAGVWTGYPSQLLEQLRNCANDDVLRSRQFPKNARALSGRLERLAPDLDDAGITVRYDPPDRHNRRQIEIRKKLDSSDNDATGETSATSAMSARHVREAQSSAELGYQTLTGSTDPLPVA